GALVLYVLTLAPTTQLWDASEYITAAHALGIPHPPGSPLFVLLAHAWGMLPLGVDYARRINLFAATTSAVAAGLWFLIGERWLRSIVSVAERGRLVPSSVSRRSGARSRGRVERQPLHSDSGALRPISQPGRSNGLGGAQSGARARSVRQGLGIRHPDVSARARQPGPLARPVRA